MSWSRGMHRLPKSDPAQGLELLRQWQRPHATLGHDVNQKPSIVCT